VTSVTSIQKMKNLPLLAESSFIVPTSKFLDLRTSASRNTIACYFDFFIDPMKLGPVSDPSSWIMKSTFSPLGVQSSMTLSSFTL
jgi:hypothetical protein